MSMAQHFPYQAEERSLGYKATLGMIVLQSDLTLEQDMRKVIPCDGVALYVSRIPNAPEVTGGTLRAMEEDLPFATNLLPHNLAFDALGYGCTSASALIGSERIAELIRTQRTAKSVITPISALIDACRNLNLKKLALVTPYIAEVTQELKNSIRSYGIRFGSEACFDEILDQRVAQLSSIALSEAALTVGRGESCDAVFLSCTNLRTIEIIEDLEQKLDRPVISSNSALIWALLRHAGINDSLPDLGKLGKVNLN